MREAMFLPPPTGNGMFLCSAGVIQARERA